MLSAAPSAGPPAKRGDNASGHKALVEGMKVGLRAQYVKSGEMSPDVIKEASKTHARAGRALGPSQMVEDLKIGLRAHYTRRGEPINEGRGSLTETTMSPSVGTQPDRALGASSHLGGGNLGRRKDKPTEKGNSSLRGHIQTLEKNLEATLTSLSNNRSFTENDEEIKSLLIDALADYIMQGDGRKLKEFKMQATLIESSKYIGDPSPETHEVLTASNDNGAQFKERMGSCSSGPIVEMVATQLSSGVPLYTVRTNIATAMQSTTNQRVRGTLMKAARVLADM